MEYESNGNINKNLSIKEHLLKLNQNKKVL